MKYVFKRECAWHLKERFVGCRSPQKSKLRNWKMKGTTWWLLLLLPLQRIDGLLFGYWENGPVLVSSGITPITLSGAVIMYPLTWCLVAPQITCYLKKTPKLNTKYNQKCRIHYLPPAVLSILWFPVSFKGVPQRCTNLSPTPLLYWK